MDFETKRKADCWDYYKELVKEHGFDGITDLLAESRRLKDENKSLKSAWQAKVLEQKDSVIAKQEECNDWLKAENSRLQAIIDEANAQEPCFEVGRHGKSGEYFLNEMKANSKLQKGMKLYSAPIPSQQSPGVVVHDDYNTALTVYDNLTDDRKRLFKEYVFQTWPALNPNQSTRITEQDSVEIILNFYWFMDSFKSKNGRNPSAIEWYESTGKDLLNKLNNNQ